MTALRRALPPVLLLLSTFAAAELLAWAAFALVLKDRGLVWRDLDALAQGASEAELARFRAGNYDRELGWLRPPRAEDTRVGPSGRTWSFRLDERGARSNPYPGEPGRISVYGDSFAFGDEVDDDECWTYRLSQLSGARVDNWGMSAWGPDQALLRLRRNLPEQRTDVVILVVQSENARRVLNSYRPFLTGRPTMRFAFKPMLGRRGGELAWIPNPLERADNLADFARALERARRTDTWYAENQRRPRSRFPYTLALVRALVFRLGTPRSPYDRPEARARLDRILEEFHGLAGLHGFTPLVLFIPEPRQLERFAASGDYDYRGYVAALRARADLAGLRVIDLLEHPFDPERFNLVRFRHHPTPYGHRVIARVVHEALRE